MGEVRRQTANGLKWTAIERFSIQGTQFILGIFVARLLTPAEYGLVGMLTIFIAISQTLIDSGMGNALIRKLDRSQNDFSTVFYFNMAVSILCAATIFFSSGLIAEFFNQPQLSPIAKVLSFNLIIGALGTVQIAQFTIAIDFKTQAKVNLFSAVVSGLAGLLLAWLGYGVWALVWQGIIASTLQTVCYWIRSSWRPSLVFSMESFHNLFGYGSKLMASALLHSVYSEMTTIVIGKFYTPASLGNYNRGTSMATTPCNMITSMLGRVTFPIFARIQNEDEHLIRIYRKYIRVVMMPVVFCLILLASLGRPIILFLLTAKWEAAIIFLQIFVFAIMFDPICQLNLNLLQVKGRSDLFLRLEVIKKSIALVILIVSIPFGVLAICISKVIYTQVAVFINTYYTGKLFGLGYLQQWRDFLPYILYAVVACAPASLFAYFCPIHIISIIVGAVSACLIYSLILLKKRDDSFMEFAYPLIIKLFRKFKPIKTTCQ